MLDAVTIDSWATDARNLLADATPGPWGLAGPFTLPLPFPTGQTHSVGRIGPSDHRGGLVGNRAGGSDVYGTLADLSLAAAAPALAERLVVLAVEVERLTAALNGTLFGDQS